MGTSSAFGGQGGGTPLVPSWLGNEGSPPAAPDGAEARYYAMMGKPAMAA
jgi:hypothetical protein